MKGVVIIKRTICKEVKFSDEEWCRVLSKAKKYGMLPAVYIRNKALNGKVLFCDLSDGSVDVNYSVNEPILILNKVAKTVNTEKCVFRKDVDEAEKAVAMLGDIAENMLVPFSFREIE